MWHTHHGRPPIPSRDPTWSSSSRNSSFKTIQKGQYMSDQAETHRTPRKPERTLWQSPQSQRSMYPQSQGTSPVLPQQTRHRPHQVDNWYSEWNIGMWMILHDPGPQWQSLQKEQSSFEAHMSWWLLLSRPFGKYRPIRTWAHLVFSNKIWEATGGTYSIPPYKPWQMRMGGGWGCRLNLAKKDFLKFLV